MAGLSLHFLSPRLSVYEDFVQRMKWTEPGDTKDEELLSEIQARMVQPSGWLRLNDPQHTYFSQNKQDKIVENLFMKKVRKTPIQIVLHEFKYRGIKFTMRS